MRKVSAQTPFRAANTVTTTTTTELVKEWLHWRFAHVLFY